MEQNIVKRVLQIGGMTCTGCETRIENVLKKFAGIESVKAIYSSANVYITYDSNVLKLEEIVEAIEKLDYKVENNPLNSVQTNTKEFEKNTKNKSKYDIGKIIGVGIIMFALYMIINHTIGFNFIPQVDQSMGYGLLFIVGLLTSLHCIAMCGGINLSVCVQYNTGTEGSKKSKLKPSMLYNLGRVISYTVVGGIVGALGSAISFSGTAKGVVAVLSGIFMVIMGLNMLNIFPWLKKLNPRLPKFIGRKLHNSSGGKKRGPLYVGLLNGFMPCGPLQAMQLYALGTGSFTAGALSMFLFSLGTVPLMFGFGAVSSFLSSKFTHKMLKVSAVLVIVLGVIMLNRGLNLSGFGIASAAVNTSTTQSIARVENGVQLVTTKLEAGSYAPIVVQKGIPVKWTIKAGEEDLNGCNNPVTIPKYNIQKKLQVGDNVIEFIPQEEGNIVYTCWMGMISSNISVVADISKVTEQDLSDLTSDTGAIGQAGSKAGGSCCAAGAKATEFKNGNIPTDKIAVAKLEDGIQTVSINVNDYGFSPAVVVMQKGVQTNFIINGEQLNYCNNKIVFPEYGSNIELKDGENKLELVPDSNFSFSCWMGMLNGYIKVVDDIDIVDLDALRKEVKSFKPSGVAAGGAGGCCG